MNSYTGDTQRLSSGAAPQTIAVQYESNNRKLHLVYSVKQVKQVSPVRQVAFGVMLGSLILFGALGYGFTIGGLTLSALIVLAFYQAGKGLHDAND